MSIQTLLENWRQYIHVNDFDNLCDFIMRTHSGEKLNKILVLEGSGSNGKSSFINELRQYLTQSHLDPAQTFATHLDEYNGIVTENLAEVVDSCSQLVILTEFELDSMIENNLRLLAKKSDFVNRHAYCPPRTDQINGNFVMCVNAELPPSLNDIVTRVRFVHRF